MVTVDDSGCEFEIAISAAGLADGSIENIVGDAANAGGLVSASVAGTAARLALGRVEHSHNIGCVGAVGHTSTVVKHIGWGARGTVDSIGAGKTASLAAEALTCAHAGVCG